MTRHAAECSAVAWQGRRLVQLCPGWHCHLAQKMSCCGRCAEAGQKRALEHGQLAMYTPARSALLDAKSSQARASTSRQQLSSHRRPSPPIRQCQKATKNRRCTHLPREQHHQTPPPPCHPPGRGPSGTPVHLAALLPRLRELLRAHARHKHVAHAVQLKVALGGRHARLAHLRGHHLRRSLKRGGV